VTAPLAAPRIVTERLVLTALRADDAAALLAYRENPAVQRYQTWSPTSLGEVRQFISDVNDTPFDTPGTWFQLAIRLRDDEQLVGDVGVHFLSAESRHVEIGFTVAPEWQGRGLGSEAITGLLGYLFDSLDKHRVVASVDPANRASIALLRKVGMREEGLFPKSLLIRGEWVDDMVFALSRSEWGAR